MYSGPTINLVQPIIVPEAALRHRSGELSIASYLCRGLAVVHDRPQRPIALGCTRSHSELCPLFRLVHTVTCVYVLVKIIYGRTVAARAPVWSFIGLQ